MSEGRCIAACADASFSVAGTRLGSDCYCGNEIWNGHDKTNEGCEMECNAARETKCGERKAMTVWKKD